MADVKTGVSISVPAMSGTGSIGEVAVSYRTHFSVTHALSAARLAREAAAVERMAGTPDPANEMIRACATGAIMVSVAFVEATIAEFFLDFVENKAPEPWKAVLPQERRTLAAQRWREFEKLPTLDKFNEALKLFGKKPFEKGQDPFQRAKVVIDARDALVHAKPVTHSDIAEHSTEEAVRLSKAMQGKFAPNRFMANNPAFPDGLLGGGGARWAFEACLALTDEFFRRLGIRPRYELERARLAR
jgi:hypothetical protein